MFIYLLYTYSGWASNTHPQDLALDDKPDTTRLTSFAPSIPYPLAQNCPGLWTDRCVRFCPAPLPHRAREGRHASIPDLIPVHVKTNQLSQGPAGARRSERRETDVRDLVIAQEELLAGSQGPTLKRSGESRTSRAASTRGETHEACRTMPPRFDAIQADGRVGQHGEGSESGGRTSTRLLFCPIFGLSGTLKD